MEITLNDDQVELLKRLVDFYKGDDQFFVISGAAGVGKTTMMRMLTRVLKKKKPGIKICMSAPTNKAVSVLRTSVNDFSIDFKTIYSLLGLRMEATGAIKELKDKGQTTIENYDLVVLDEGSMVSEELLEYIESKTAISGTKMVIIGDRAQLPPVKEKDSPIWKKFPVDFELTKIMRHQNSILAFVTSIRDNPKPVFVSTGEDVMIESDTEFMDGIEQAAKKGLFHSGEAKAIAFRNVTVDFLNRLIREAHCPGIDSDFVVGDRVVFKEPVYQEVGKNKIPLAHTDQEGIVTKVDVTTHNKYPLKAWKLQIKLDGGSTITSYVIHEAGKALYQDMLDKYSSTKSWFPFWKLKESFHSISHSYAMTTHRSQGSSIPEIFVEVGDIFLNRNIEDRTKMLYVACSRASKKLHIFV
jgi:energy-coupling factor transporter ATP-binding protein EcfA2